MVFGDKVWHNVRGCDMPQSKAVKLTLRFMKNITCNEAIYVLARTRHCRLLRPSICNARTRSAATSRRKSSKTRAACRGSFERRHCRGRRSNQFPSWRRQPRTARSVVNVRTSVARHGQCKNTAGEPTAGRTPDGRPSKQGPQHQVAWTNGIHRRRFFNGRHAAGGLGRQAEDADEQRVERIAAQQARRFQTRGRGEGGRAEGRARLVAAASRTSGRVGRRKADERGGADSGGRAGARRVAKAAQGTARPSVVGHAALFEVNRNETGAV